MTFSSTLLQYVRENPGVPGSTVHRRFENEHSNNSISSTLARLQRQGLIENRGVSGNPLSEWYAIEKEEVDSEFLAVARVVYHQMINVPKYEREILLARAMQRLVKSR